jgi:hypothetical protein
MLSASRKYNIKITVFCIGVIRFHISLVVGGVRRPSMHFHIHPSTLIFLFSAIIFVCMD